MLVIPPYGKEYVDEHNKSVRARFAREVLPSLIRAHPNASTDYLVQRAFDLADTYFKKREK